MNKRTTHFEVLNYNSIIIFLLQMKKTITYQKYNTVPITLKVSLKYKTKLLCKN